MERPAGRPGGGPFGGRQVALAHTQPATGGLQVHRGGVVHAGQHALGAQLGTDALTRVEFDSEQVVDVTAIRRVIGRELQRQSSQQLTVPRSDAAALVIV